MQYDTNPDGSVNYNQITLGAGQAPGGTRIGNVAPGILPGDAVNVQQLNDVRNQIGDVARVAYWARRWRSRCRAPTCRRSTRARRPWAWAWAATRATARWR
ncbi:hypothetical protein [Variovorax sp. UC122_21]|uniref:hypothetical protein n=1 Tax=Variovorax sp. UC122_21 TaxID=3374554 RepID=UPI003756367E